MIEHIANIGKKVRLYDKTISSDIVDLKSRKDTFDTKSYQNTIKVNFDTVECKFELDELIYECKAEDLELGLSGMKKGGHRTGGSFLAKNSEDVQDKHLNAILNFLGIRDYFINTEGFKELFQEELVDNILEVFSSQTKKDFKPVKSLILNNFYKDIAFSKYLFDDTSWEEYLPKLLKITQKTKSIKGVDIEMIIEIQDLFNKVENSLNAIFTDTTYTDKVSELSKHIKDFINKNNLKNCLILFTIDGEYPYNIDKYKEKFRNYLFDENYTPDTKRGIECNDFCHLCGEHTKVYSSVDFTFFTNAKGCFTNVWGDGNEFAVCEECLKDIIVGRHFTEKHLKTSWLWRSVNCDGKAMLLIPHNLTEKAFKFLKRTHTCEEKENISKQVNSAINSEKALNKKDKVKTVTYTELGYLNKDEKSVLKGISDNLSMLDLILFEQSNASWKFRKSIECIDKTRLGDIAKALEDTNNLNLDAILIMLTQQDKINDLQKNRGIGILECILEGNKLDFNDVVSKLEKYYRSNYFKLEDKKKHHSKYYMSKTLQVLSFLSNLNVLDRQIKIDEGSNFGMEYGDYTMSYSEAIDDFFAKNERFFTTDSRKAWFLLGTLLKSTMYEADKYYDRVGKGVKPSFGNFIQSRIFDRDTYFYIIGLCKEQISKYDRDGKLMLKFEKRFELIRRLMQNGDEQLNTTEAKYAFSWGTEVRFITKYSKKCEEETEIENTEINEQ